MCGNDDDVYGKVYRDAGDEKVSHVTAVSNCIDSAAQGMYLSVCRNIRNVMMFCVTDVPGRSNRNSKKYL